MTHVPRGADDDRLRVLTVRRPVRPVRLTDYCPLNVKYGFQLSEICESNFQNVVYITSKKCWPRGGKEKVCEFEGFND